MVIRKKLLISGRVQGVGYRYGAEAEASRLELVGWVRNLTDGKVEMVVEGDKKAVEEMIEWCWRGNRYAKVEDIQITSEKPEGLIRFEIVT